MEHVVPIPCRLHISLGLALAPCFSIVDA
ncbi:hypothetical protein AZE42_14211 [Rhizopogon vesiculosus]|uniref:Uncharacterized protein n=1 Tax=Rhizopogon vesiculosus TaxID=180088 RepID=A0A1J8Q5W1_9AGAM|nr:hypothetical protein AZE42_14211 [Rhizopogon vesiculosus]